MPARKDSGPDLPAFIPLEVVRGDEHLSTVEKADVDQFAVGGRSARRKAVEGMFVLERRLDDRLLPHGATVRAMISHQHSVVARQVGSHEKDEVAPDDRRGVAQIGDRRLPGDVVVAAPARGNALFETRSISPRSAPPRPVLGRQIARGHKIRRQQTQRQHDFQHQILQLYQAIEKSEVRKTRGRKMKRDSTTENPARPAAATKIERTTKNTKHTKKEVPKNDGRTGTPICASSH